MVVYFIKLWNSGFDVLPPIPLQLAMTMFNDLELCRLFLVELDFLVANAALCDLLVFCCGLGDQILVELVSNCN